MLLAEKSTGHLIEVLDVPALVDPMEATVKCSLHYGEEAQDPEQFDKAGLKFPSGESLPLCWMEPNYRRDNKRS